MATKGLGKSANFPKIVKVTTPSNKYCKKIFRLRKRKGQEGEFFSHCKANSCYFFRFLRNLRPSRRPAWSSLEISLRFENCDGERCQKVFRFRKPLNGIYDFLANHDKSMKAKRNYKRLKLPKDWDREPSSWSKSCSQKRKLFFYFRQEESVRGNGFTKESWLLLITVNEDRFVMQTI